MPSIKIISAGIVGVLAFVLLGYFGFRAAYYENQYLMAQKDFVSVARRVAGGEGVIRGTLVSTDPATRLVTFLTPNPYTGVGTMQRSLPVFANTVILKQAETPRADGVGYTLSTSPITLEDLASMPAGTQAKFVIVADADGRAVLMTLVVGNEPF